MTVITSIADLREQARKRVPRAIFDYADRGFFIELAQELRGMFGEPITRRARIRIRFMVGAPIDDPGAQAQEAISLIARVLSLPSNP